MKIKHRITAAVMLIAMMMGQATILSKAAEEADTTVYHYLYSDYSDAASVVQGAGITRETNDVNWQNGISPSWGTPTQTMVGTQKGVWWFASSKSINNTSKPASNPGNYVKNTVEQNFATVHLDTDGIQGGDSESVMELVLDYGVLLTGTGNGTPYMKLPVTGIDNQGSGRILAMLVMNGTSLYFEGIPQSRQEFLPKVDIDGNKPGQRSYVKILFDMRSQTYSAYYLKKSQTGAAEESEEAPEMIVANAPFYESGETSAVSVSKLDILMKYQAGSDLFAPVEIKLTKLGSASIYAQDKTDVENALAGLEVSLSKDADSPTVIETGKLPVTSMGLPIVWQSDSEYASVSEDGTIYTRKPAADAGDQAVCISGRIAKGQAAADVFYYVMVKAEEAPAESKLSVGDYMVVGNYNGEDILWRCVDIDKNGALMLADQVLCVKPFDFPGENLSGSHGRGYQNGRDRIRYGSNYWGDSNIRCWLNSDAGPGAVAWSCENPPVSPNPLTMFNPYDQEAGFLNGFSQKDKNAVKKTTIL